MPQHNNQNQNGNNAQSANYQNAQSGARTVNGIAQPMDPMGDAGGNPFEVVDQKNGDHYTQNLPTNQQGMPQGAPQFQAPTNFAPNQQAPTDESASPMDKWFTKPDNGTQGQAPNAAPDGQPVVQAQQPANPEAFQSVFAKAKMEEFQALVGKRDYTKDLFTPELAASFKEGDFEGLPALINAAVQQGASMTAFASSRLSDQAVNGMFQNFQNTVLPQLLNEHSTSSMWQAKGMEDFNSTAMQPMVQMVSNQVKSMNPTASPQQLQQLTLQMLQDYSKSLGDMNFQQGANQEELQTPVELSAMERLFN